VVLGICLVITGFIIADTKIIRHRIPEKEEVSVDFNAAEVASQGTLDSFVSEYIPSIALDNSVMLSSVIKEAQQGGFTSVTFDIKRENGTVGYASQLVMVNTFGAVSSPAAKLHESMNSLRSSNIESVGRVCCLKDNLAPRKNSKLGITKNGKLYFDGNGNTYLDPDNEDAYSYLLDIVTESRNLGLNVMILSGCNLPNDVKKGHGDGFDKLSKRLYADIGGDVTFLEGVDAQIKGWDAENGEYNSKGIKNDIEKLPKLKENQVYVITTRRDKGEVNSALKKAGIKKYVITDD
jgi:hypothetical protein